MDIVDPFDQPKRGIVDPFDKPLGATFSGPMAADAAAVAPLAKGDAAAPVIGKLGQGAMDVGATLASRLTPAGMLPQIAGGVGGLGALLSGGGLDAATNKIQSIEQALNYEPQTAAGKATAAVPDYVFGKIGEGAKYAGEKAGDVTGSPAVGAGVETVAQLLPLILGERAIRGGVGAANAIRAADLSRGDASVMPGIDADMAARPQPADMVNQLTDSLRTKLKAVDDAAKQPVQPPPAPSQTTVAPEPVAGAAATPPPPAVAAALDKVTGGDPAAKAAIIAKATQGKLLPGETPENLAASSSGSLPPHLQSLADKIDARNAANGFSITDVTPQGYGPSGPSVGSVERNPTIHLTTEQAAAKRSIAEAETLLKGKMSADKRASIERGLAQSRTRLELANKQAGVDASPSLDDKPYPGRSTNPAALSATSEAANVKPGPTPPVANSGDTGAGVVSAGNQTTPEAAARATTLADNPGAAAPLHPWTPSSADVPIPPVGVVPNEASVVEVPASLDAKPVVDGGEHLLGSGAQADTILSRMDGLDKNRKFGEPPPPGYNELQDEWNSFSPSEKRDAMARRDASQTQSAGSDSKSEPVVGGGDEHLLDKTPTSTHQFYGPDGVVEHELPRPMTAMEERQRAEDSSKNDQQTQSRESVIAKAIAGGAKLTKAVVGETRKSAASGGGYEPKTEWRLQINKDSYLPLSEDEAKNLPEPKQAKQPVSPFLPEDRHTAALDNHLAELGNITDKQRAAVIRKHGDVELDPVFQLPTRKDMVPGLKAAQESGQPSAYGEVDIGNVGGLNAHAGSNSAADVHLKAVGGIVNRHVQEAAKQAGGQAYVVRKGGDELGVISRGVDAGTLEDALSKARAEVSDYAKKNGLENYPNPKKGGAKEGLGLHYGVAENSKGRSIADTIKHADSLVEQRKKGAPYEQRGTDEAVGSGASSGPTGSRPVGGVAPVKRETGSGSRNRQGETASAGAETAVAEQELKQAPPKPAAETVAPEQRDTSVRNAATYVDRATRGEEPIDEADHRGWGKAQSEAAQKMAADPEYARNLASEVVDAKRKRALSDTETMALGAERVRLHDAHDKAIDDIDAAMKSGDGIAEAQARARKGAIESDLDLNERATQYGGTPLARAMAARNALATEDYSNARVQTRARVAYGSQFTKAVEARVKDLTDKLAEKDKQLEAMKDVQEKVKSKAKSSRAAKVQADIKAKISDLEEKIAKRLKACPL